MASEAFYHLRGGKSSGMVPHVMKGSHWFFRDSHTNRIFDITKNQFDETPDYSLGRPAAFLSNGNMKIDMPSKRALILIYRVIEDLQKKRCIQ